MITIKSIENRVNPPYSTYKVRYTLTDLFGESEMELLYSTTLPHMSEKKLTELIIESYGV